ncbi:MAG: 5'/3'-nucleotidase SurE [Myxococcota bacterium]|jgi:5'-nucleotidase
MNILLTNDDGVEAGGIVALEKRLAEDGHNISVVAPEHESSACGHGISLHRPLRIRNRRPGVYSVDGTPTDCVNLAVYEVLKVRPDIIIAGINQGPNMGTDTLYSGTVAGAIEGAILGISSIAVSLVSYEIADFEPAAGFIASLIHGRKSFTLPADVCLNINVPVSVRTGGYPVKVTSLGKRRYSKVIKEGTDPRGKKYYWIGGDPQELDMRDCCDTAAVKAGLISITPLKLDLTAHEHVPAITSGVLARFLKTGKRSGFRKK